MIAGITKSNAFSKIIHYNEMKVEEGTAELLYNNTLTEGAENLTLYFTEVVNQNKKVKVEKSQHIYISLPPGEELNNDQLTDLSLRYLQRMGYENAPHLIYRHFDTDKHHVHIITTTVDFEAKWLNTKQDYERSVSISRDLEQELNLQPTIPNKQENKKRTLQEINAYKHSIQKAIKLKAEEPYFSDQFRTLVPNQIKTKILSENSFSDNQISHEFIKQNKGEQFLQLQQLLIQHNLIYKLKKDMLIDKLKYIKSLSHNYKDFISRIEAHGLYVREKSTTSGKRIIYGDANQSIYLNHKQQPKAFKFERIINLKTTAPVYDKKAQKRFLTTTIKKSLYKTTSLEQLEKLLSLQNITTKYSSNKAGISGISFQSNTVDKAVLFKGSELNYSIATINKILADNLSKENELNKRKQSPGGIASQTQGVKNIGKQMDTGQDSEDQDDALKSGKNI